MTRKVLAPARLPATQIDPDTTITFTFDGERYPAHPGDTIASALSAAGVRIFSRSFKYHRPRGLLCCAGQCPNCLVQVGDEPSVRSCTREVQDGMIVSPQNVRGSLQRDLMSVTQLGDRFLPVGFYYKAFIHPQSMWHVYEKFLRHAAGLGKVNLDTPPGHYFKEYLHTDVAVVGGGPAGLSAALGAAASGARVLLLDESDALGGHLRYSSGNAEALERLVGEVESHERIVRYTKTAVIGWYEENWLAAVSPRPEGEVLFKIRAGAVVFATGAYEQPLLFDNNDLPGVMLGSGIQRLIHLFGVAPGRRAVVLACGPHGWQVAADMRQAGIEVAAVADLRSGPGLAPEAAELVSKGVPVYWNHGIFAAEGNREVGSAIIAPLSAAGEVTGASRRVPCDLIAICANWTPANGLLYQAGATITYDEASNLFLPTSIPAGVFAAGRVNGAFVLENELAEGTRAGREAARVAGFEPAEQPPEDAELVRETAPGSALVRVKGNHKRFLCYCEDVTDSDLETAIAEGYDSIELLKRYSTISMGPCQGKMCSLNTIHLCARANQWTIDQTGTTTARPPMTPVSLGALAGQNMEPVQVSPVHEWHKAAGAKLMIAGLWLRPEHYGDRMAEVRAVREAVGLIDVSTLGKLRLTGPGVPELLDRLYINKWRVMEIGRVRYGIMCNDEGIILDDGVTARIGDQEWYTTTTSSGAGAIFEWMQWWVQSGWGQGVHVANVTEVYAAFNLTGPSSRAVLQQVVESDISNDALAYMYAREIEVAGVPCRVLRIGFTGELSFEIHCPSGYGWHVWEALMDAGAAHGIRPFGVEAQRILRLEKAHIIVGQDTDGLTDPIAANQAWAVKLDKDDFLGQRALTRVSESGPKERLVGFKMVERNIVPDEGLQIVRPGTNGRLEIIGWVTSCRHSPTLDETIGLCWLPADVAATAGQSFTIRVNGKLETAIVHHGPFYDPDGTRLRM